MTWTNHPIIVYHVATTPSRDLSAPRRCALVAGRRRKAPPEQHAGNCMHPPETAGNRRKPPDTAGKCTKQFCRKLPEWPAGNCWKLPESAGKPQAVSPSQGPARLAPQDGGRRGEIWRLAALSALTNPHERCSFLLLWVPSCKPLHKIHHSKGGFGPEVLAIIGAPNVG